MSNVRVYNMGFILLIAILLFALAPIIVPLVFSEIMAAKEGDKTNDFPRKTSKILGWVFFVLVSLFLIYLALTHESGNPHFNQTFKIISFLFGFFK